MKNGVSLQGSCKPGAKGHHNPSKAVPQQPREVVTATGPIDSPAIIRQRQGHEWGPKPIQKIRIII